MNIQNKILAEIQKHKVDFVRFVDISHLPKKQNKGFPNTILFGMALTPSFIKKVHSTPNYVQEMIRTKQIKNDEFHLKELQTDGIADSLAQFIIEQGYNAYSQSEKSIGDSGYFHAETHTTPLPHKTIATMAGLGWIGKNNLLITGQFGCAISMCSVLTNAPIKIQNFKSQNSKCGNCTLCRDICMPKAIKGIEWNIEILRDDIIDVHKCTTCLECMMICPYTQQFSKNQLTIKQLQK